jgi:hypothetical protein
MRLKAAALKALLVPKPVDKALPGLHVKLLLK